MSDVVGIDLGTTFSVLGAADETGRVEFARTRDGRSDLRSAVLVSDGSVVVGEEAYRMSPLHPEDFFELFKRSMGEDTSYAGGTWTPEGLSAEVLKALAEDAEESLGSRPSRAVITIPAYFGDDARRATRQAAEQAGLEPIALLHEPTAACLAYRHDGERERTVLVYDLGGGTFDVSVVRFAADEAEVLATAGDHRLGGRDWDNALAVLLAEKVEALGRDDPTDDPSLLAELTERAREAKHALSALPSARVNVPTSSGIEALEVSSADYAVRCEGLFTRTEELVRATVDEVGGASAIDEVLLVGGSTRMPECARVLDRAVGRPPAKGMDPDRSVAYGAAVVAGRAGGSAAQAVTRSTAAIQRFSDVTAHALGFVVVSADGSRYVNEVMIERNSRIPTSRTKVLTLDVGKASARNLEVHMLQGEAERPLDTRPLGSWTFESITSARGRVEVEVSYEYDGDGVAAVSAAVDGQSLGAPKIDRNTRDLQWTDGDPAEQQASDNTAVALVIDVSGSMSGAKLDEAKAALCGFVEIFDETGLGERLALIPFGSEAACHAHVGDSAVSVVRAIERVEVAGSTNMAAGLREARKQLPVDIDQRVVVLLTDGSPDDRGAALQEGQRLAGEGISIMARGVQGADESFLRQLDTEGGQMVDLSELASSFRGIARQLTQPTALGARA